MKQRENLKPCKLSSFLWLFRERNLRERERGDFSWVLLIVTVAAALQQLEETVKKADPNFISPSSLHCKNENFNLIFWKKKIVYLLIYYYYYFQKKKIIKFKNILKLNL